jgi:hypothetical protein
MQIASAVLNEDWLSQYASDTAAILSFFGRQSDHSELLRTALSLVEQVFAPTNRPVVKVRKVPEFDEEWLVIETTVPGTVDQALNAYREFVREWVNASPPALRSYIRLAYEVE